MKSVIVGAGIVVIKDVPDNVVMADAFAKVLKYKEVMRGGVSSYRYFYSCFINRIAA